MSPSKEARLRKLARPLSREARLPPRILRKATAKVFTKEVAKVFIKEFTMFTKELTKALTKLAKPSPRKLTI